MNRSQAAVRAADLTVVAGLLASAIAFAQPAGPATLGKSDKGQTMLETPDGKALYVYDQDPAGSGESRCVSTCVNSWRPFSASDAAARGASGDWTVIARDDGTKQWAFRGRPLYTFYRDLAPGQTNGDIFEGGKWHVARP